MTDIKYSENDLNTNLNELAHETLREFFLACKKVSIYSSSHPLAQKAINLAFMQMEKIFRFKKFFDVYISSGNLYALNIMTRPSVFIEKFMDFMQIHDVSSILFGAGITARQLSLFLERFVKKMPVANYKNILANYLRENKIDTVLIDSELGNTLFKDGQRYQGDVPGDFSVRNIVSQAIGDKFGDLAELLNVEDTDFNTYIAKYKIDYYPALAAYLIPEKIASMNTDRLVQYLADIVAELVESKRAIAEMDPSLLKHGKDLIDALHYHPHRQDIIERVGALMVVRGIEKDVYSAVLPEASSIKVESSEKIDGFLYSTFNEALPGYQLGEFNDLFNRLLRTGQQEKAQSVINILLNHLAGPNLDLRNKALTLFHYGFKDFPAETGRPLLKHLTDKIAAYIADGRETFEFSDLIWELTQIALANKNYEYLSSMYDILINKRNLNNGVWVYDSIAVKKAIEELNRQEVIDKLIVDLINCPNNQSPFIRNIFIAIGSKEAALALAQIISHNSRHVRQNVLKTLSEMGKSSLEVFTELLNNQELFTREKGKRELPDDKWYIVRNSIFVLGALADPEGCKALRIRINDTDIRVRRAIVQALEKINGERAADLLIIAADDPDQEIREAAVIALGFVGTEEIIPELLELIFRHPSDAVNIINTLGRLGGIEAKQFLLDLLNNREKLGLLTSVRSSRDDLKLATIKALGRIGDQESLEKIKEFNDSLPASSKIFFGGTKLTKAADEILKRNK